MISDKSSWWRAIRDTFRLAMPERARCPATTLAPHHLQSRSPTATLRASAQRWVDLGREVGILVSGESCSKRAMRSGCWFIVLVAIAVALRTGVPASAEAEVQRTPSLRQANLPDGRCRGRQQRIARHLPDVGVVAGERVPHGCNQPCGCRRSCSIHAADVGGARSCRSVRSRPSDPPGRPTPRRTRPPVWQFRARCRCLQRRRRPPLEMAARAIRPTS